jgi:hypothetical protein
MIGTENVLRNMLAACESYPVTDRFGDVIEVRDEAARGRIATLRASSGRVSV